MLRKQVTNEKRRGASRAGSTAAMNNKPAARGKMKVRRGRVIVTKI
jgi:hypothetical protein